MNKQSLLLRETSPPTGKQLGRQLPYVIRVILVEGQVQLEPSKRGAYDSLGGSVSLLWVVFCRRGVGLGSFFAFVFCKVLFLFFSFLKFFSVQTSIQGVPRGSPLSWELGAGTHSWEDALPWVNSVLRPPPPTCSCFPCPFPRPLTLSDWPSTSVRQVSKMPLLLFAASDVNF